MNKSDEKVQNHQTSTDQSKKKTYKFVKTNIVKLRFQFSPYEQTQISICNKEHPDCKTIKEATTILVHAILPVVLQLHRTDSLKFSDKLSPPGTLAPHLAFRKTCDTDNCIYVTIHTVGDASVPPTTESSSRIQNEEKTRQDPAAYVTARTMSQQICQPYNSLQITTTSH